MWCHVDMTSPKVDRILSNLIRDANLGESLVLFRKETYWSTFSCIPGWIIPKKNIQIYSVTGLFFFQYSVPFQVFWKNVFRKRTYFYILCLHSTKNHPRIPKKRNPKKLFWKSQFFIFCACIPKRTIFVFQKGICNLLLFRKSQNFIFWANIPKKSNFHSEKNIFPYKPCEVISIVYLMCAVMYLTIALMHRQIIHAMICVTIQWLLTSG